MILWTVIPAAASIAAAVLTGSAGWLCLGAIPAICSLIGAAIDMDVVTIDFDPAQPSDSEGGDAD